MAKGSGVGGRRRGALACLLLALAAPDPASSDVHRVVFGPSIEWEAFDTLTFSTIVPVPERQASALLLAGLVALAGWRRRPAAA